jgi:hypothetical protein
MMFSFFLKKLLYEVGERRSTVGNQRNADLLLKNTPTCLLMWVDK